jgi:hypothetical protein
LKGEREHILLDEGKDPENDLEGGRADQLVSSFPKSQKNAILRYKI